MSTCEGIKSILPKATVFILHSRITYTVITFVDSYVNVVLLAGFVFQCEEVYKLDQSAHNCSSDPPALSFVK